MGCSCAGNEREALEADHATGQIDQDGCKACVTCAVRDIPDGRGGGFRLIFMGALYWCPSGPATEPGEGQMGNVS